MTWWRWLALGGVAGVGGYWLMRYLQPEQSPLVLNGSVVIVTGASSGIGRAYAESFARRGAKVVLVARRHALLDSVKQQIEPYATDVLMLPTDVMDEAALRNVVERTVERFGRIDVLINNAGVLTTGSLHTLSADAIRAMLRTNLEAAVLLTTLALPTLLAQRSGKIVNVASFGGRVALPGAVPYITSKHGLMGFSDSLRRELFGTGVDVTSVLPFWTRTEMVPADVQARLRQIDTPEFVAERTIDALLKAMPNVIFGGYEARIGLWTERHLPRLLNLYWRMQMTPKYLERNRTGT
jgi:short-subunit dehydrogenase